MATSPRRRKLPAATKQAVLLESGYKCGNPICRHIITLEIHHIEWVRDGGGDDASNLIALCPNCHALHTADQIPREAIEVWKGSSCRSAMPTEQALTSYSCWPPMRRGS